MGIRPRLFTDSAGALEKHLVPTLMRTMWTPHSDFIFYTILVCLHSPVSHESPTDILIVVLVGNEPLAGRTPTGANYQMKLSHSAVIIPLINVSHCS